MNIAFNTLNENPDNPSGSLFFFQDIISTLQTLDNENSYYILISNKNRKLFETATFNNFHYLLSGKSNESIILRMLSEFFVIPLILYRNKIEVYYTTSSNSVASFLIPKKCKVVCAIYATQHFKQNMSLGFFRKLYRKIINRIAIKKAYRIIVNSESCKNDLFDNLKNINKEIVRLVYHGFSSNKFNNKDLTNNESDYLYKLKIPNKYILFVSVIWEYKNVDTLIEAFGKYIERTDSQHYLVFAGDFDVKSFGNTNASYKEKLLEIANTYNIEERLIFLGNIPNNCIRPLYKNAELYIQPSLYETFGKSTIEAMMCGCPIIGADSGSTPEIIKEAGLLFNPLDSDDLRSKIECILQNPEIRSEFIEKGLIRGSQFSITAEANKLINIFKE